MKPDPLADSHIAEAAHAAAIAKEAEQKSQAIQINAAVEEGFKTLFTSGGFNDAVAKSIQTNVNGKIDKMDKKLDEHNTNHEKDMERILPIIEAFEEAKQLSESAKTSGKVILWIAGFITAVGGAWIVIKQIFNI